MSWYSFSTSTSSVGFTGTPLRAVPSAVAFGGALSVGAVRAGVRRARGISDGSENRPLIHKSHSTVKHGEKKILKNYLITHNSDELVLKIRKISPPCKFPARFLLREAIERGLDELEDLVCNFLIFWHILNDYIIRRASQHLIYNSRCAYNQLSHHHHIRHKTGGKWNLSFLCL